MRSIRIAPLSAAVAAAATLAFAGCGSSDDTSTTSTAEAPSPAKAAYIAKVDKLCTEAGQQINAKVQKRVAQEGGESISNEDLTKVFTEISLPGLEELYAQIAKVKPPAEDADDVDAILSAVDEALKKAEADPESLAIVKGGSTPFDHANELQQEFGFQVCGASGQG